MKAAQKLSDTPGRLRKVAGRGMKAGQKLAGTPGMLRRS